MCLQSLHQHIGSRKWMAFEFWAHHPFNTLQLPPWIFIRVTRPCAPCNRGSCVASANMNNAGSKSWPHVQRSYIKVTCKLTRLCCIQFVVFLSFYLPTESVHRSAITNVFKILRHAWWLQIHQSDFFFFSKSLPTKICPSDSVIGTDW